MPHRSVLASLILSLSLTGLAAQAAPSLASLQQAAAQHPNDPAAANRLGLAQLDRGDGRAALLSFNAAVALNPSSAAYLANRARAYASLDQNALALADVSRALALKPGDRALLSLRASLSTGVAGRARAPDRTTADEDRDTAAALAQEDRAQTRNGVSRTAARERYYGNPARYAANGQFLPLTNFTLAAIEAARRAQPEFRRDGQAVGVEVAP